MSTGARALLSSICVHFFILVFICSFFSLMFSYSEARLAVSILFFVFSIPLCILILHFLNVAGRKKMDSWMASKAHCRFRYAWDGTGIAVDPDRREIHLAMPTKRGTVEKTYASTDIRGWSYAVYKDMRGPSMSKAVRDKEKSGLSIEVRDTGIPVWHVKFETPLFRKRETIEHDLIRWMEIIRQTVNG